MYAFNKPDRTENCVCFWDTKSDEKHVKYVKKLLQIRAGGTHCVLATRTDDNSGQFILILCNAIGYAVWWALCCVVPGDRVVSRTNVGAGRLLTPSTLTWSLRCSP